MLRWRRLFSHMLTSIEGSLRSLWSLRKDRPYPLIRGVSLLEQIKLSGPGWLTLVSQILINSGFSPPTQFAW